MPWKTHACMYSGQILQRAKTAEQGQLLLKVLSKHEIWGSDCDQGVRVFWNSYCVPDQKGNDWFRWGVFATEGVPCTSPNANPIESWHKSGISELLKGRLKGSTDYVLMKTIPDILQHYCEWTCL